MDINWFKYEDILKYSNSFTDVVYAFVVCSTVPDNCTLPYELEDCAYVGMSGGLDESYTFDRKDKNTNRGRYETQPHGRMKAHKTAFNTLTEKKYQIFSSKYSERLANGEIICVCFMTPPKHVVQMNKISWLLWIESEMIYKYQERYKQPLLMNLGHQSNSSDKRKKPNSISQQMVLSIRKQDIFELCGV